MMDYGMMNQMGMAEAGASPMNMDQPMMGNSLPPQDQELISEIYSNYEARRQMRRPYEVQWYLNAAALRGWPDVRWNAEMSRLETRKEPKHRERSRINLIRPKYTARVAKFTRIPPGPSVIPATSDREDMFNARASQMALEYVTRKIDLPQKWMTTMRWVPVTGKAFWAIRYDPKAISHTQMEGEAQPILGDVTVDFVSAFEMLVADPGIEKLGDQPEIMRIKVVPVKDLEERFQLIPGTIKGEVADADVFFYQRQIADLGSRFQGMSGRATTDKDVAPQHTLRLETFTKPCAKYPQGRYVVCAGNTILRNDQNLPGEFNHLTENPYPFVEYADEEQPGQFWPDAFCERLICMNSEYNRYRSMLKEHMTLHMFPKLLIAKQHALSPSAYDNEAGEKIEYTALPNIDKPNFLQPANILTDVWRAMEIVKKDMDDVSLIYPSVVGGTGGASSGFQTNLLQEAADQIHGPTIQSNAYTLREAYIKIRHLMKLHYDLPRLVTIAGKNNIPEVFEFSQSSIDEQADIIIEPEQMMPMMKTARMDMFRQMFREGMFGNPQDPRVLRRVNEMLRTGFNEFDNDQQQRDSEQAQLENIKMERAEQVNKPMPWEDHTLHWEIHTDLFKSPQTTTWTQQQWGQNVWHAIVHLNYINPMDAIMMAREFGLESQLLQLQMLQAPPMPPPGGMAPGAQGVPPAPGDMMPPTPDGLQPPQG